MVMSIFVDRRGFRAGPIARDRERRRRRHQEEAPDRRRDDRRGRASSTGSTARHSSESTKDARLLSGCMDARGAIRRLEVSARPVEACAATDRRAGSPPGLIVAERNICIDLRAKRQGERNRVAERAQVGFCSCMSSVAIGDPDCSAIFQDRRAAPGQASISTKTRAPRRIARHYEAHRLADIAPPISGSRGRCRKQRRRPPSIENLPGSIPAEALEIRKAPDRRHEIAVERVGKIDRRRMRVEGAAHLGGLIQSVKGARDREAAR